MVTASLRKPTNQKVSVDTTVKTPEVAPAGGNIEALVDAEVMEPSHDAVPDSSALQPRQPNAVAQAQPRSNHRAAAFDAVTGIDGDWGDDDIRFPSLKQVQGSGPLSKVFDTGTIIYGDEVLLPAPSVRPGATNTPIIFTPISIKKQFREKLSEEAQKAGEMPRIFDSVDEVEEAGLTTRWIGNVMPENYADASARCLFLLRLPAGSEHPGFALELDGQQYAVAVYYAAGGAFRSSAKVIANTALTSLLVPVLDAAGQPMKNPRGGIVKKPLLHKCFWSLQFSKVTAGNYEVWRPTVKLLTKEETGPMVRDYVSRLIASENVGDAQAE